MTQQEFENKVLSYAGNEGLVWATVDDIESRHHLLDEAGNEYGIICCPDCVVLNEGSIDLDVISLSNDEELNDFLESTFVPEDDDDDDDEPIKEFCQEVHVCCSTKEELDVVIQHLKDLRSNTVDIW